MRNAGEPVDVEASLTLKWQNSRLLRHLYLANAAVLITHEIDSAYWQEWKLFGMPGGVQLFLILNLLLVVLVLHGFQGLLLQRPHGRTISWLLAAGGLFAVVFHGSYLLLGDPGFRLPVSLGLLMATGVLSLSQCLVLWKTRDRDV